LRGAFYALFWKHLIYGFLTTAPNAVVEPTHPKAISVMLTKPEECDVWARALG
jgi:putative SOS response-associated peptidase YedK